MKMVRTKVYTKEKILNVAEKILVDKGFSNLTARNIADTMGISTQPIYLEFVNMDDLKRTLIKSPQMQSRVPLSTRVVFCSQSIVSNRAAYPMRRNASVAISTSIPVGTPSLFR